MMGTVFLVILIEGYEMEGGVIFQREENFNLRRRISFILQRAMVLTSASLVSGFLAFWVSCFLGFSVFGFLNFWVYKFLSFLAL